MKDGLNSDLPDPISADPVNKERERRRRLRNWAVFAVLGGFVLLVYTVTIVKIKLGYGQ
jgi:hypothetical protein